MQHTLLCKLASIPCAYVWHHQCAPFEVQEMCSTCNPVVNASFKSDLYLLPIDLKQQIGWVVQTLAYYIRIFVRCKGDG